MTTRFVVLAVATAMAVYAAVFAVLSVLGVELLNALLIAAACALVAAFVAGPTIRRLASGRTGPGS